MNFNFNCLFTGLCGFVFNKPLSSPPDRARVLLPKGDQAAVREGLYVHRSMLLIKNRNLKAADVDPTFVVQPRGEECTSVFLLSGVEVEFDFGGKGTPQDLQVEASPIANPEAPTGNERISVCNIGRLEKGASGASTLDSDCLGATPERVDARVRINSGRLYVRSLTQFKDQNGSFKDDIWDFRVPYGVGLPTFFSQVLADEVVLEKRDMPANVSLVGTKLNTGKTPAFRLELGPDGTETGVEIKIVCGEVEGLFDLQPYSDYPQWAMDIKLLYRLSEAWDGQSDTLGVVPVPRRRSGGIGLSIHCPRALFIDDPNA
jgi:hypothetical protein